MLDVSRHDPLEQRVDSQHVVITEAGNEALPGQHPLRVPERARPDGAACRARAARALGRLETGAVHGRQRPARLGVRAVRETIRVACVQVEPVILDRAATLDKIAAITAEAKGQGAQLVVFPETFIPAYPSSAWARFLAGWADPRAKGAFAQLARESLDVPGPDCRSPRRDRAARTRSGSSPASTSATPTRPGTLYNSLLYHAPGRQRSPCTTASSCRRTTSGSSGARATAAGCARSRPGSAGSAG